MTNSIGEIKNLPIGKVTPAPNNPLSISKSAVEVTASSIKRFGWQQPIVVDTDHVIIAGHTRLRAAKHLGLKNVPVVVAENLTPEEVRAYRIADNRTGDYTTWDYPELVRQLDELADDFADELALQDWEAVIAEFEDREDSDGKSDADLDMDESMDALINESFTITVVMQSEDAALQLESELASREGVLDVRHKR